MREADWRAKSWSQRVADGTWSSDSLSLAMVLLGVAGAPLFIILSHQLRLARSATARLHAQAAQRSARARRDGEAWHERVGAEHSEEFRRMHEARRLFEQREAGLDRHRAVLGVTRRSSPREIKEAFYRAARRTHPDTDRDNPHAAQKFAEVQRAYETLAPVDH